MLISTITSLQRFHESPNKDDKGIQTKENEETVELATPPPSEVGKPPRRTP